MVFGFRRANFVFTYLSLHLNGNRDDDSEKQAEDAGGCAAPETLDQMKKEFLVGPFNEWCWRICVFWRGWLNF